MDNMNLKMILDKLDEFIASAGGHIEAFFPIAVQKVYTVALLWTGLLGVFIFINLGIIAWLQKRCDDMDNADRVGWTVVNGVLICIWSIFIIIAMMHALNPEYYAVHDIMRMVTGNK